MELSKMTNAFKEIAKRENTTLEEVKKEIQRAIDLAMNNTDPKVMKQWKKMNFKGDKPTPEEIAILLSEKIILENE